MFGAVVTLLGVLALGQGEAKIPYQGDEITLLQVKANPERYVGKTFIACVSLEVNDYYNFHYSDKQGQ